MWNKGAFWRKKGGFRSIWPCDFLVVFHANLLWDHRWPGIDFRTMYGIVWKCENNCSALPGSEAITWYCRNRAIFGQFRQLLSVMKPPYLTTKRSFFLRIYASKLLLAPYRPWEGHANLTLSRFHQTNHFANSCLLNPFLHLIHHTNSVFTTLPEWQIKVYYFEIKFNPYKLMPYLYYILSCHMPKRWWEMDTGKVPNGHFSFFFQNLVSSQSLSNRQLIILTKTSTIKLLLGLLNLGLSRRVLLSIHGLTLGG